MRSTAMYQMLAGAIALALLTILAPPAGAQAAPPAAPAAAAGPAKIAIANPVRIFDEIQKTKDLQAQMVQEGKNLEAERLTRSAKLQDVQSQRNMLNPNAPEYAKLNQDLMTKTIEFQAWMQVNQQNLQRMQKQRIRALFEEITVAIGKVAEARGIDLVIAEQKPQIPDNMDDLTVQQLQALLSSRNLLYSKDAIDLTPTVIAAMDADYKSGK